MIIFDAHARQLRECSFRNQQYLQHKTFTIVILGILVGNNDNILSLHVSISHCEKSIH